MPTEPKPTSPAYYWLNYVAELQALLDSSDRRYSDVLGLLYAEDDEFLVVSNFCTVEPGNPGDITSADLSSGAWKDKYRQAARQAAFYKLCRDV